MMSKYSILAVLSILLCTEMEAQRFSVKKIDAATALQALRSRRDLRSNKPLYNVFGSDGKCGLHIAGNLLEIERKMTEAQRSELHQLITPYSTQYDTVINRFHVYYDTSAYYTYYTSLNNTIDSVLVDNVPAILDGSGQRIPNTARAYVDSLVNIFNHVWDYEVHTLGYAAPPFEPGESSYRIFIFSQEGDYGGTNWDMSLPALNPQDPAPRYPCWIEIDPDFRFTFTTGMDALKVTAAHEFHHVIQIGSYGFWGSDDLYANELTSTWMEGVVYPAVHDYYQYLPDYFYHFGDGRPFNDLIYHGYERAIWGHFISKRFSLTLMTEVWTEMVNTQFLQSSDVVLQRHGSNLASEFALFTKWNYYTGYRADTILYYSQGNAYPLFRPLNTASFNGNTVTMYANVNAMSSSMYEFYLLQDTITTITANIDISSAEQRDPTSRSITLSLSNGGLSQPYVILSNGLQVSYSVTNPQEWRWWFMFDSTEAPRQKLFVSPNPLVLSNNGDLILPTSDLYNRDIDIYFYSVSLNLVYSGNFLVDKRYGKQAAIVPIAQLRSKLSSGVYIVVGKSGDRDFTWKLAVIR